MHSFPWFLLSIGKSTKFKVLDECSAMVKKSIEGLDKFVMEGSRGFGELEAMLNPLANQDEEVRLLKERLQEGKRYLKSEYKVCYIMHNL